MNSMARFMFVIISFLGILQLGSSKQCYSCAGTPFDMPGNIPNMPPQIKTVSKACADPFRANELMNAKVSCDDPISTCTKIEVKIGEVEVVMRGCLPPESCTVFKDCVTCKGDLCNSSSVILPSFMFITLISALIAKITL